MTFIKKYSLHLTFIIALMATLGSLYFSEIAKFPPCVLCWYQRIFIYPIVFISAVGLILKETRIYLYILPLAFVGIFISIFHNLLYYKILPESATPCLNGISCTTKYIEWFGFITIPLLALLTFIVLIVLMFINRSANKTAIYEN